MDIATLRTKSVEELTTLLRDSRAQLADLRFKMSTNELKNTNELRNTRRTIARILTVLRDHRTASAVTSGAAVASRA